MCWRLRSTLFSFNIQIDPILEVLFDDIAVKFAIAEEVNHRGKDNLFIFHWRLLDAFVKSDSLSLVSDNIQRA